MAYEAVNFAFFSELIGSPVLSLSDNRSIGRLVDLAATTGQVYPKVSGLLVRTKPAAKPVYVPWSSIGRISPGSPILVDATRSSLTGGPAASQNEILLAKSFLDRQIISTSGSKVVRVNDLHLLIDNTAKEKPNLWLVHIDIGIKGLLRRLGFLRIVNAAFRWLYARDIKDKFVPWKHVQPTTTTNIEGSLQLTADTAKLSEIHPADLADIVEDLGIDERISLLESLDPSIAAATLQEMPLNIRAQIAETLDEAKLAAIISAMQTDESVDLFDELSADKRNLLTGLLPPERVSELHELSKLPSHSVGSIMNTGLITVPRGLTVRDALDRVQQEASSAELYSYLYVVDEADRLTGVVGLRTILTAPSDVLIEDVMRENVATVKIDDRLKDVAQLFLKYNFDAVPVVDDERKILGFVTLRDTLDSVIPQMREEGRT